MAVRLQMKIGVIAEHDRLPDSPDTIIVVEPSVGSVARSKGHLYLLVTARVSTRHALEATRMTAETIRNEYYYDESAGIRVCLQKAIATANKRLAHQGDRLGLKSPGGNGPIGVGVAVVRGNEMYVATVGPAEAYLIRQARLSTLPDPHRERGLPSGELEPDVWRGEISVGDSLVLVSPNIVARLGADELKDAMLTLHPQSAMEHLHQRFIVADGSGSDGAIAFEATEVSATARQRTLVPVRPAEPLAGAPDRSPIPLADNVQAAGNAVSAAAGNAKVAAGGAFERVVGRMQEFMPRRKPVYRRVTPLATRRETQRRAAVAMLAFLFVVGSLGFGVWASGSTSTPPETIGSVTAGQRALETARANLARVTGRGIDLIETDPTQAMRLLTEAYQQLDVAADAGVASRTVDPLRAEAIVGLDRLYGVVPVRSTTLFTFERPEDGAPINLRALIRGPDGNPFVLDASRNAVFRVDLQEKVATRALREDQEAAGATVAVPKLLGTGGRDLLILDTKNVMWRWRAADEEGKGTVTRVRINGAAEWGDDVPAIGTFIRVASEGLYNLYVIDPSAEQILAYSPARDGSGFPAKATNWLSTARQTDKMTAMHIDGDIFVVEDGQLVRFVSGRSDGWEASQPGDTLLRRETRYSLLAAGPERREGSVYVYDRPNRRIVAIDKLNGTFRAQYRLAGGVDGWNDIRGFYVVASAEEDVPPRLIWMSRDSIHEAVLEEVPDVAPPTPSPEATDEEPSEDPEATPEP